MNICKHTNQKVKATKDGWEMYCCECNCFLGKHGFCSSIDNGITTIEKENKKSKQ